MGIVTLMAPHEEIRTHIKAARFRVVARIGRRPRREWFSQLGAFGDDFFSDE